MAKEIELKCQTGSGCWNEILKSRTEDSGGVCVHLRVCVLFCARVSACLCVSEHVEMLRRDNEETGRGDISMMGQRRLPEIDYVKRKRC